jgi:hypothetical protein
MKEEIILKLMDMLMGSEKPESNSKGINRQVGKKVVVRTYSAGCWFGTLKEKSGSEIILSDARRLRRYWCRKGVSMCGVAEDGIVSEKSEIERARTDDVNITAIEIHTATERSIESIESAEDLGQKND